MLSIFQSNYNILYFNFVRNYNLFLENACNLFFEELKHTPTICEVFMDNKVLAEMIREKYYEEKMTAEYKLQLNKVVELEDNF